MRLAGVERAGARAVEARDRFPGARSGIIRGRVCDGGDEQGDRKRHDRSQASRSDRPFVGRIRDRVYDDADGSIRGRCGGWSSYQPGFKLRRNLLEHRHSGNEPCRSRAERFEVPLWEDPQAYIRNSGRESRAGGESQPDGLSSPDSRLVRSKGDQAPDWITKGVSVLDREKELKRLKKDQPPTPTGGGAPD